MVGLRGGHHVKAGYNPVHCYRVTLCQRLLTVGAFLLAFFLGA